MKNDPRDKYVTKYKYGEAPFGEKYGKIQHISRLGVTVTYLCLNDDNKFSYHTNEEPLPELKDESI